MQKHCELSVIPLLPFSCTEGIVKNSFHATDLQLPENCKLILQCNPFLTLLN